MPGRLLRTNGELTKLGGVRWHVTDDELLFMVTYLEEVYTKPDIRKFVKQTFKLQEMSERYSTHGIKRKEEKKLLKEAKESLHVKT